MSWDVDRYLVFERERTRPARDLVAALEPASFDRILDLGCGPGNSTALLASQWPRAQLHALDSDAGMVKAARERTPGATFVEQDLTTFAPDKPFDLVFSNAVLQWAPHHESLLPRILSWVAPGGTLAVQMPSNHGDPSHVLMRHIGRTASWVERARPFIALPPVLEPTEYYDILSRHAATVQVWETRYFQVVDGPEGVVEWMRGTRLAPLLRALGDDKDDFLRVYTEAVADAYPRQPDGKVLFPFRRVFFVATKAASSG